MTDLPLTILAELRAANGKCMLTRRPRRSRTEGGLIGGAGKDVTHGFGADDPGVLQRNNLNIL
jgi:hypothetical protein